jgi:hypothetical protein
MRLLFPSVLHCPLSAFSVIGVGVRFNFRFPHRTGNDSDVGVGLGQIAAVDLHPVPEVAVVVQVLITIVYKKELLPTKTFFSDFGVELGDNHLKF